MRVSVEDVSTLQSPVHDRQDSVTPSTPSTASLHRQQQTYLGRSYTMDLFLFYWEAARLRKWWAYDIIFGLYISEYEHILRKMFKPELIILLTGKIYISCESHWSDYINMKKSILRSCLHLGIYHIINVLNIYIQEMLHHDKFIENWTSLKFLLMASLKIMSQTPSWSLESRYKKEQEVLKPYWKKGGLLVSSCSYSVNNFLQCSLSLTAHCSIYFPVYLFLSLKTSRAN